MRVFDPRDSAYAVNLTYDRHTYIYTYISCEISIEHPSVGLASLAQLFAPLENNTSLLQCFTAESSQELRRNVEP